MCCFMKKQFKFIFTFSCVILLASCAHIPSPSLSLASAPNTTNKAALRIYQALPVYAKAAKMPWKPIQMDVPLKVGRRDNHIPIIRERLIALQDLQSGDPKSTLLDSQLSHAISQFQYLNGLKQTGIIDKQTVNALDITPAQRYRELVQSMNQWAQYPEDQNSRYIQVNIPSYTMRLVAQGEDVLEMKAIVGRPM